MDTLVGLDTEGDIVRRQGLAEGPLEQNVRRALKMNDDLGCLLRQRLARAEVKRHSLPAPVVDEQLHGGERCRLRAGRYVVGLMVTFVLSAYALLRCRCSVEGPDGRQDLDFLVAERRGFE